MPLDLAFDSLGDDEFQCLLFVMLKLVGWCFFLLVYPCKHISSHHVHGSSLGGYVASGCPLSPSFISFLALAPSPPLATSILLSLVWAHAPLLSLQLAAGAALPPGPRVPAQSAGAPCGRLPPSPLGLATLRGMAASAASPPVAVAAAATAATEAIVPWC